MAGLCNDGAAGDAGFTVRLAFRVTPPNEPVMVTAVWLETADVVTVNVLLAAPALTVTLAGTDAAAELSDSVTTAPPAGAGALSRTVPVDEAPPVTVVGLTVSDVKVVDCAWVTPSAAKSVVSPRVATSCAVVAPARRERGRGERRARCAGRHGDASAGRSPSLAASCSG